MTHALTIPASLRHVPAELRIPHPPLGRRLQFVRGEPWWREAMRWSLIALTASWVAGEATLLLLGL